MYQLQADKYVLLQQLPNTGPTQAVAIDATSGAIAYSAVGDAGPTNLCSYNPDTQQYEIRQVLTNNVYSADWSETGLHLFLGHGKVLEIYQYDDVEDKYTLWTKL